MERKIVLSEVHSDMLAEIFNMGMGQSLGVLSNITGRGFEITFTLPRVELGSRADFLSRVNEFQRMALIVQEYYGEINGNAIFYLPSASGKELARLLIGTEITAEQVEKLESEAMVEIGNIFINSSISCLSSFLNVPIQTRLPEMMFPDRIASWMAGSDEILHLHAEFKVEHLSIAGNVAYVLDDASIRRLLEIIDGRMSEV